MRKTYSPEQFRKIIIDILQLYRLETMMVAASIKLPFPARTAKDRIETKLYAVMELVAEEIAREYTEKIFADVEISCSVKMKTEGFTFPVGRVEYFYMYPVTFDEFLAALQETEALNYLSAITTDSVIPEEIHSLVMKKFQEYVLVGGMPEAVARYADTRSFIDVDPVYESLLTGFRDDVAKYASAARTKYIQHIIENAAHYVDQ